LGFLSPPSNQPISYRPGKSEWEIDGFLVVSNGGKVDGVVAEDISNATAIGTGRLRIHNTLVLFEADTEEGGTLLIALQSRLTGTTLA